MDVAVRGHINGQEILIVIECKDFDPNSTGKVGREYVDALDSKRHDLNASIAIICSNSGFTIDALRKAKRKGIGMISVLRKGDSRAKAEILEEIFLRRIQFRDVRFTYTGVDDIAPRLAGRSTLHLLRFDGYSLDDWLQHRATLIAIANPFCNQPLTASFEFKQPLTFGCGEESMILRAVGTSFVYNTEWLRQTVRLEAAAGMYDYIRGRIRLAPGENQYVIDGINWDTAEPCDPPEKSILLSTGSVPGEIDVALTMIEGLNIEALQLSQLEHHVAPNDLTCEIPKRKN